MTTPTQHLEIFDEKFGNMYIGEESIGDEEYDSVYLPQDCADKLKQHLIQVVISVLEQQIAHLDTLKKRRKYVSDKGEVRLVVQNTRSTQGITACIDSLTTTLSTWKALLE